MRVLIADDDAISRRVLESTLTRFGHEVTAVDNGLAAISLLLAPDGPRLAILDWMMPGADGLTVCRSVRERSEPYVYVILLTSRDRREDMVAALDAEADDFLTKPFDALELRARLRPGERVIDLQTRLFEARDSLQEAATHDRLTGLENRGAIVDRLDMEFRRARREGLPIAFILGDLDHFKAVNDDYGHLAGDAVLRQAADRMQSVVRDRDSIGRYGGEEFLVLIPGCEHEMARTIAERLRAAVAASPMMVGDTPLPITLSVGLAWTACATGEPATLIQLADEALYRAKGAGRNQVSE